MRILQVIARMNVGGTARYLDALVTGLQAQGHEVLLATGFVQGDEVEDSVVDRLAVARIGHLGRALNPVQDVLARRELQEVVERFRPDVIHSHTFKAGLLARTLAPAIPHIHTYHGHPFVDPEFSGAKATVIAAIERALAHRSALLGSVGQQVAKDLVAQGIGRSEQYVNLPPAVEPLRLMARRDARVKFGLAEDQVVVGWLGRMIPVKAPERLLAVAAALPDVTFLMGGGGPLVDAIRAAAPDNVQVLGWADAVEVYSAADFSMLTSVSEGMPVALIEAQLAGLPVVCTDVGSVGEVVTHGRTGFVVQPEELVEAARRMVDDAELRATFGAAAKSQASMRFAPEAMITAHLAAYKRVLARR